MLHLERREVGAVTMGVPRAARTLLAVALLAWTSAAHAQAPSPAPPPPPSNSTDPEVFARAARAMEQRDKQRPQAVKPRTREQAARDQASPSTAPR
jgi:hypothetical protein